MPSLALSRVVLYVRDIPAVAVFSQRHFGLAFGPVHGAPGHCFANAKDPAGNAIAISSRGMA